MTVGSPLLATKLFAPEVRSGQVARPRLVACLNQGLGGKLTLVSAPAGFGKTTLVGGWLRDAQRPFAWLSLDEGDNQPAGFLLYLRAALQQINGAWGQAIDTALHAPQLLSFQPVLTGLINEIAVDGRRFVLVLDDYHAITNAAIHQMLAFLLDHLPPGMHLVLITRADPPLPVARLRVRGHLNEIRVDELRFTVEETTSFLNQVMGLDLTPEQIATLEARTEGWIAGLQLAALSLKGLGKDAAGFINAFAGSHRYVMDYLIEEVFNRQPSYIQEFLLQTSVLNRMCGPLCDTILDLDAWWLVHGPDQSQVPGRVIQSPSQRILEHLEATNLFTVPLDQERHWYRYHHLFADLLRDRLRQTSPGRLPTLHLRAAAWYEQNGLMEDAVHHALQARDFDLATRLIVQVTDALWARSEVGTVLRWMKALPEELIYAQPRLCHIYASAVANVGQLDAVEPLLQAVEAWLAETPASPPCVVSAPLGAQRDPHRVLAPEDPEWRYATREGLLAMVEIRRAFVARFSDHIPDAIALCERALDRAPASNLFVQSMALLFKGHAHFLLGDTGMANRALMAASAAAQASGHLAVYLSALHYLAQLRTLQGRLHEARAIYQDAIRFVVEQKEDVFAGIEQVGLGDLLREWNDLDGAARHLREGLRLAERGGDFVFLRDGYLAHARLEWAQGNLARALALVQKAEQVVRRHQCGWELALVEAWRARLWLAQGDLAAASQWAQAYGLRVEDELCFLYEFGHLTRVRVCLARGDLDGAGQLLDRLLPLAEASGRMGRVIEILLLQALVRWAGSDSRAALSFFERALALAEPEGYVRIFVDEGAPVAGLLQQALSRGIAPGYVRRLLAAGLGAAAVQPQVDPSLADPLTARELEVLNLIAAGLRNQEIADQLVISLATVKRHISNIYGKLRVSHRTQAVVRARELGLLPLEC